MARRAIPAAGGFVLEAAGARLKNRPAVVGYNILNEPVPERAAGVRDVQTQDMTAWSAKIENTPADLNRFNARIAAAIREVDKETPVVIDCGRWATAYAINWLKPLRDRRVLYSVHMYEPYSYTNRKTNNDRFSYPGKVLVETETADGETNGSESKRRGAR